MAIAFAGSLPYTLETLGSAFDENQPFVARFDDHPTLWYFQLGSGWTARLVNSRRPSSGEFEMLLSCRMPESFQRFSEIGFWRTDLLLGIGVLLAALLDGQTGTLTTQLWHSAEAVRLLSLDQTQCLPSLHGLRRLLRQSLPRPNEVAAIVLTNVISPKRPFQNLGRLSELNDISGWGTLTSEELAKVANLSSQGRLQRPMDPRTEAHSGYFDEGDLPSSVVSEHAWPFVEDTWAIEEMSAMFRDQESQRVGIEINRQKLIRQLKAIRAILAREERDAEEWFGEVLGWCHMCLSFLRREEMGRVRIDGEKEWLSAAQWESVLSARAPWWRERAEGGPGRIGWFWCQPTTRIIIQAVLHGELPIRSSNPLPTSTKPLAPSGR